MADARRWFPPLFRAASVAEREALHGGARGASNLACYTIIMLDRPAFVDDETFARALGMRYLWWERERMDSVPLRRIVAQIMDIGDYDDIESAFKRLGPAPFRDAIQHALPGWFRPRSWSYWHLRLGLRKPGAPTPPRPTRTYG